MDEFFAYIMTNNARMLLGMTNDLRRRVSEHRLGMISSFTGRYRITQLAWLESFSDVNEAIEWEKKIKGWTRAKKIALIESKNPPWFGLSGNWILPTEV